MIKNKKRYGNLCLPTSVNSSVIELKKLSRRLKLEMKRHPVHSHSLTLNETYNSVNLLLQRMRQLESDYVANSEYTLNDGRKKYQKDLIDSRKVNMHPHSINIARGEIPYFDRGITISKFDSWRNFFVPSSYNYTVEAIGMMGYESDLMHIKGSEHTYMITLKEQPLSNFRAEIRYITIPIAEFVQKFFLHDVYFDNHEYSPEYCNSCGEWQNAWANDGGYKLNAD